MDSNSTGQKNFLTVAQVADILEIGKISVYRLVWENQIPHYKILGRIKFLRTDVDKFLESCKIGAAMG
jgi:excisionase family DNA binding protein